MAPPPLTKEQQAQAERFRSVTIKWAFAVNDVRDVPIVEPFITAGNNGVYIPVGTWEPEEGCDIATFRAEQDCAAGGALYRTALYVAINVPSPAAVHNPGSEAIVLLDTIRLTSIEFAFPQGKRTFTMKRGDKLFVYSATAAYAPRVEVDGDIQIYYNRRFGE